MFYDYSFTIPANTTEASPKRQDVRLTHGVINRVEVGFPAGCCGLVHCQIKEGLHQLWPTNPDGSFNSDDYNVPINEHHELFRAPYMLTLVGWNLDDTFPHTLELRFSILPKWLFVPATGLTSMVRKITPPWRL